MDGRKCKMWDEMKMVNAIKADMSEEMGLRKKKTSKLFEVPRTTLKNSVDNKETDVKKLITTRLGRKPELPYNL
jgi:hypothetical protein